MPLYYGADGRNCGIRIQAVGSRLEPSQQPLYRRPFIDLSGIGSGRSRFEVRLGVGVVLSVTRG
jgi:hypothetical protein